MKGKGFVVVLEGCDKTGKTTMAAQLSAILSWPVLKYGQPGPSGALRECMYALEHHDGPFIADRFHVGENVYGPLYRGAGMNQFDVRAIENALMERGALMVLMEDDPEKIIARFKALKEDFAREEDVRAICSEYDRLYRSSRLSKIRAPLHQQLPSLVANLVYLMSGAAAEEKR